MPDQCTVAAQIAKNAELLECAYSASELYWKGTKEAELWLPPSKPLQTTSAKRLITAILSVKPTTWWEDLCNQVQVQ